MGVFRENNKVEQKVPWNNSRLPITKEVKINRLYRN